MDLPWRQMVSTEPAETVQAAPDGQKTQWEKT
jgi:hypothetical protein